MMVEDEDAPNVLGERLRFLIQTVPRPEEEGGGLYEITEVASLVHVSRGHLHHILSGQKVPTWTIVVRLARLFGVDTAYFEPSERGNEYMQQMEVLGALAKLKASSVEFRGQPLSAESAKKVVEFATYLQQLETKGPHANNDMES